MSKALLRSMKSTPASFWVLYCYLSWAYLSKLTSVPSPYIKPVCDFCNLWFVKDLIWSAICNSSNFLMGLITVIGLISLILGVLGAILFTRMSLPFMCWMNFYSSLMLLKISVRVRSLLQSVYSYWVGCKMLSGIRSMDRALFLLEGNLNTSKQVITDF